MLGSQALAVCRRRAALNLFHAQCRAMSAAAADLRARLTTELKTSMKAKNTSTSTVLRSILSEVYSADKMTADGSKITDSAIRGIMQKGVVKRTEAASQFKAASRPDLADKETSEIQLLQTFLPPKLSESQLDEAISKILQETDIDTKDKRAQGLFMKEFFARVEKETVDIDSLKQKAQKLFA